jgi:hypothetical protein
MYVYVDSTGLEYTLGRTTPQTCPGKALGPARPLCSDNVSVPPGAVHAPGCSTWQIHARVRLLLVFGFGLAGWQMLIRFKPTKSMGPKHLEGHTSIGHDIDKMSEPSLIRTLPARRRGSGTTKSND